MASDPKSPGRYQPTQSASSSTGEKNYFYLCSVGVVSLPSSQELALSIFNAKLSHVELPKNLGIEFGMNSDDGGDSSAGGGGGDIGVIFFSSGCWGGGGGLVSCVGKATDRLAALNNVCPGYQKRHMAI